MAAPGATLDTIVALSSGALPAGIAIVRVSGPRAHAAAARFASIPAVGEAAFRKFVDPADGTLIDEGLLLRFDAPRSATGEDVVEFHVHGSRAVVDRLLARLEKIENVRLAEPGEFTRRALCNGKLDLVAAEALGDLLEAETELQRRAALNIYKGGLDRRIAALSDRLVMLSAEAEAAIDYVGDEEEIGRADSLQDGVRKALEEVDALLALPSRRILHDGLRVVLGGPVNAGKSSLFNALVGYDRAIVTAEAGTTRDTIEIPMLLGDRKYILVDTAGLRAGAGAIEGKGMMRSEAEFDRADILIWLGDPDECPRGEAVIPIKSKADLHDVTADETRLSVSARTGHGIDRLLGEIQALAERCFPTDDLTVNHRQAALLKRLKDHMENDNANPVIIASNLMLARRTLGELTGAGTLDDVLDRIFSRFCLGK